MLNIFKKKIIQLDQNSPDLARLERFVSQQNGKIKLHIGCGPRVLKEWINIDLAYEPFENYLKYYKDEFYGKKIRGNRSDFYAINITKQALPLANNSVSVVFHEDFIEHLDQKEQMLFLAEIHRVLKKEGVHRINTPSLAASMKINSKFKNGFEGVYQHEWDHHVHKNILTKNMLKEMATIIGYSKVIIQKRNISIAKTIPNEYRPDPNDRAESGNIFVDLIK